MDVRAHDERAVRFAERVVARVTDDQLTAATPCTEWTLNELLVHMTGSNNGFADTAEGRPTNPEVWLGTTIGDDVVAEYLKSSQRVRAAFAAPEALTRTFDVHGFGTYPATTAIGMHFIDYLAHGWDVAKATGTEAVLDEDLCEAVLAMGSRWPKGAPTIWGPGAPFGHPVPIPEEATAQDRMLGFLGRTPTWPDTPTTTA
jgi:uncharacterized protein (TIGR03086 family)